MKTQLRKKRKKNRLRVNRIIIASVIALALISGGIYLVVTGIKATIAMVVDAIPTTEPEPEAPVVITDYCHDPLITQTIDGMIDGSEADYALVYYNLHGECATSHNADVPWLAASTAKVAIAMLAYDEIANGFWQAETWITYNPDSHFESGGGPLEHDADFTGASVETLTQLMISESDNIATNMLLSQLGWTRGTQAYIETITGIQASDPSRNLITPTQHQRVLSHLVQPTTPGHTEILTWMFESSDGSRLKNVTTWDQQPLMVAHKTGDFFENGLYYRHDIAIVAGSEPYILIVLSETDNPEREEIDEHIRAIGQTLASLHG